MTMFLFRTPLNTSIATVLGASLVAQSLFPSSAIAQRTFFSDVPNSYWAKPFIERLVREGVINGYSDGTFKPEQTVTRAQFATILRNAFSEDAVRRSRTFKDVPAKHWAAAAIDKAYTTGFMSGYPDNTFRPDLKITKAQTLVYLSNGLQLPEPKSVSKALSFYRDSTEISEDSKVGIAAATENKLVVNYPKTSFLNPTDEVTRADVAAAVYQALVKQGNLPALPAESKTVAYIVNYAAKDQTASSSSPTSTNSTTTSTTTENTSTSQNNKLVARGTALTARYPGGNDVKLIVASSETVQTNLEVAQSVANASGTTLIPVGSQIQGRFQPVNISGTAGSQYFADRLIVDGKTYTVSITSDPLAPTPKESISPNSVRGGLSTLAGRLLLGRIFGGGINLGSILGGVLGGGNSSSLGGLLGGSNDSLGGLLGGSTQSGNVVVVEPSKLPLKMQSDLIVARQSNGNRHLALSIAPRFSHR
ncbi:S-layer homology domain-containing protein [Altericista sp. CCNU0014]|uniref:S-layer homology domain-containing protein n=1 Tax=Altericista sp. CCNU0014 TaxID=3082949 RepID=UPI00384D0C79